MAAYRNHLEQLVEERTAKLAETLGELKAGEERLSYALEATNDGVFDWDLMTNSCHTNIAYFRMLGYGPDEFPKYGSQLFLLQVGWR